MQKIEKIFYLEQKKRCSLKKTTLLILLIPLLEHLTYPLNAGNQCIYFFFRIV